MAVTFPIYAAEGWPARINACRHRKPRDGPGVHADPIGDTLNLIDPDTLPRRLEAAGMVGAPGEGRRAVVPLEGCETLGQRRTLAPWVRICHLDRQSPCVS
jgi:hypothetical protein